MYIYIYWEIKNIKTSDKPINISINDMMIWMNLTKKELTKKRTFAKHFWYDWYDWLINYIPEPAKNMGRVKDQFMTLFKTKDYGKPERGRETIWRKHN